MGNYKPAKFSRERAAEVCLRNKALRCGITIEQLRQDALVDLESRDLLADLTKLASEEADFYTKEIS